MNDDGIVSGLVSKKERFGLLGLPQRIFCSKCSEPLYTGLELETPVEIIQRNGGYCPKCGKKLSFEVDNLKISQAASTPPPSSNGPLRG